MNEIDILLVEDNSCDAEMTIEALTQNISTSKILRVKDGEEALDFLFSDGKFKNWPSDVKPKVILLDLKMPKVSGIEVLQKIKSDEQTKRIPLVILTSSKEDPDIKKCYDIGVNSYVVKPVDFNEFRKVITGLGLYWMIVNQKPI